MNKQIIPRFYAFFLHFAVAISNSVEFYFLLRPWCWYFFTFAVAVFCSICNLLQYLKLVTSFMYSELVTSCLHLMPPHCCLRRDCEQLLFMLWLVLLPKCWLGDQLSQTSDEKSLGNSSLQLQQGERGKPWQWTSQVTLEVPHHRTHQPQWLTYVTAEGYNPVFTHM